MSETLFCDCGRSYEINDYTAEMREFAMKAGAAVAFGVMGMAEAIQRNEDSKDLRAELSALRATARASTSAPTKGEP